MQRKPRVEVEGGLYHVITRGNNGQVIFERSYNPGWEQGRREHEVAIRDHIKSQNRRPDPYFADAD